MKRGIKILAGLFLNMVIFHAAQAQGIADDMNGLHTVLEQLYNEMLPLCSKLIDAARGIASFAAIWYIGSRVWRHIANAEPIDFYPLFRPFVLGFAILIFPSVLSLINAVIQPTITATAAMVKDSDKAIAQLLKAKEKAIKKTSAWQMYVGETGNGDRDKWYKYTHPEDLSGTDESIIASIGNDIKFAMSKAAYNFRNSIKLWLSEILRILYEAAALCIDTIRTFNLVVLAILGPLVFGIAVFDGFQHTLTVWLARYLNIFLWLPVANIFGSIIGRIQEKMIALDIKQVEASGDTFFSSTDTAYLIFMIIGIVGYFTVPSVANYIVHAGGGNSLLHKVTNIMTSTGRTALQVGGSGPGMAADALGSMAGTVRNNMAAQGSSDGYFAGNKSDSSGSKNTSGSYYKDRLKGNA